MTLSIFCPQCDTLILDQAACPACGWQRPPAEAGVGAEVWRIELGRKLARPRCYPVMAAGYYCVAAQDATVIAVDLEAREIVWEHAPDAQVTADALASDGTRIFVGSIDTNPVPQSGKALLALDARTGQEAWRSAIAAHSLSMATVADGTVFVTSSAGRLYALDAAGGQVRWSTAHPHWGPAAPAVGAGIVCAGGRGETLVAYAAADGTERWRFAGNGWFATQLAIVQDCVYAWGWDGLLYAFDAHSGRLRWQVQGERGEGFTTPPVVAGEQLFIGCRVYRDNNGTRERTYALLALDPADGAELWRFYADKHIAAPVAVAAGTVFCASDDGLFYALDAAQGDAQWHFRTDTRIVTQPQVVGDLVYAGERSGSMHALRWQALPAPQESDLRMLLDTGDYVEAAAIYALRGDYTRAARLYEQQLNQLPEAAQLYERAGVPSQAASLWEREGNLQRARELFRAANDQPGLARVLEGMGELLPAAQVYQQMGDRESAARLYEQAGDRTRAATLYDQLGQFARASAIWQSLGDWERLVKTLLAAGQPAEAAQVLEQQGKRERAAELYEQAEQLPAALRLRVQLGHWERVADLADRTGEYTQAAAAYEHLGQDLCAAAAYERAAQQALGRPDPDEAEVARLFEQAARYYQAGLDQEHADACSRQVQRYRRLPALVADVRAHEAFVEGEWNTLTLQVRNIGYGPAFNVSIELQGPFEYRSDAPLHLQWLRPDQAQSLELYLCPQREQRGKVPLQLIVTYEDQHGEPQTLSQLVPVYVNRHDDPQRKHTPPELHVESHPETGQTATPLPAARSAALPELARLPLTLRFVPQGDTTRIFWEADVIGRRTSTFVNPFGGDMLALIIKALDAVQWPGYPQSGPPFSPQERERLADRQLWEQDRVTPDIDRRIGRALYDALVADPEGMAALGTVRDHATAQDLPITYLLRFPPEATRLAALPWEVLHDQQSALLLSRGQLASCVRYLDLQQALPPATPPGDKLRILAIAPDAGIPASVRSAERAARTAAWERLMHLEIVEVEELNPATPAGLVDRIQQGPRVDIVHFYGHGRYTDGQGALLLDDDGGGERWVRADQLAALFSSARLVFLHACQSAMISDKGLLTGVAPALSAAGVPAVVAMQLTVRLTAATRFAEIVYRSLARGNSLQRAVSLARQALYVEESDSASWYVPTVMIRARDTGPLHLVQNVRA